jgi:transposase
LRRVWSTCATASTGLRAIVEQVLKRNPNEGHLFVFVGKRRDMLEILFWDKNGYVVYFKRLERGRFQLPAALGFENYRDPG